MCWNMVGFYKKEFDLFCKTTLDAGLVLSGKKCHLFVPEITIVGHRVNGEGRRPGVAKTEKLMAWPAPSNVLGKGRNCPGLSDSSSPRFSPNVELTFPSLQSQ
jgi:hypothetical protein